MIVRNNSSSTSSLNLVENEQGVFFVLTAILAGVVIFFLVAIGIDTWMTSVARFQAASELETICMEGAQRLPITDQAIGRMVELLRGFIVDKNGVRFSTINKFRMIIPTSSTFLPVSGIDTDHSPFINGSNPYSLSSNPLVTMGCPIGTGNCEVIGDVTDASVAEDYPENFWNPYGENSPTSRSNDAFQDQIGCELMLHVKTFLSGLREVNVKTVWEIKQRGALYGSGFAPYGQRGQKGGGLIVGIATEMNSSIATTSSTTGAEFSRFKFPTPSTVFDPQNPIRNFFSNLPGQDPLTLGISGNVNGFAYQRTSIPNLVATQPFYGSPNNAVTAGQSSTPREERLSACMNPAILIRNALLIHIVGKASRMWLRDKTEILHINPIPFLPADESNTYPANNPTPPTIMVPGGSDIASASFQLPYVNYSYWDTGALPGGTLPYNLRPDHPLDRIRLGSLRDCYHIWGTSSNKLTRYADNQLSNQLAEPPTIYASSFGAISSPPYDSLSNNWDQDPSDPSQLLTAEQLVKTLGSTQDCPQGFIGNPPGVSPSWPAPSSPTPDPYAQIISPYGSSYGNLIQCSKRPPENNINKRPSGLRGDLRAFMAYVLNSYPIAIGTPFGAFESPGYNFNLTPWQTTPIVPVFNSLSPHVLIFTHTRLTTAEAASIQPYTTALNAQGRGVTVVFIPLFASDLAPQVITNFRTAFNIAYSSTSNINLPNMLFVIAPTSSTSASGIIPSNSDGAWNARYINYWIGTTTSPGLLVAARKNIQTIGEVIFNKRLTFTNLKF